MRRAAKTEPSNSSSDSDSGAHANSDRSRGTRKRARIARFRTDSHPAPPPPTVRQPSRIEPPSTAQAAAPAARALGSWGFPKLETVGKEEPPGPFNLVPRGVAPGWAPPF
jgi:hypothetical protein